MINNTQAYCHLSLSSKMLKAASGRCTQPSSVPRTHQQGECLLVDL